MYKESFGTDKQGAPVTVYTLENKQGMQVRITDYGATLVSVLVPDRDGVKRDVLLGFDNVTGYENHTCYFGAVIGRNGNRIADARAVISGITYELDANDNENNLHSGFHGIDKKIWTVKEYTDTSLVMTCVSADLEQGFPGNMDIEVAYGLTDENMLDIRYQAVSDKDTVANFTNHAYFNLAGHDSGTVLDQELMLAASAYTPVTDAKLIPVGENVPVEGTPMDFRKAKAIGLDIEAEDMQLKYGGGYDHNFVLDKSQKGAFELMARAYAPRTGILMTAWTDRPCVQFYAGNFIGKLNGKQGAVYADRHGFCLESQAVPNAVNVPAFESTVVKAGEVYRARTGYQFSVQ